MRSLIPVDDKVAITDIPYVGPAYNISSASNWGDYAENVLGNDFPFDQFTLEGTINPSKRNDMHLFSITDNYANSLLGVSVVSEDGFTSFKINTPRKTQEFATHVDYTNKWFSFRLIADGDINRLYVDCEEISRQRILNTQITLKLKPQNLMYVGAEKSFAKNFFGGIRELTIYNFAKRGGNFCPVKKAKRTANIDDEDLVEASGEVEDDTEVSF